MIRAALFDLDGIVIVGRTRYFSHRLSEEHSIPLPEIEKFFLGDFKKCTFGKGDLKEEIASHLAAWNWPSTVDEFLAYWFGTEKTKDEAVLERINALRAKGIKCYIATRQEKYRMQYLLDEVGLAPYFDGAFVTCDVGFDKSESAFFMHVLETLKLPAEEVLFFDDKQVNVDTARTLGIDAHFYTDISVLQRETDQLL